MGERFFEAELHGLRAELLRLLPACGDEAQGAARRALAIARAQHAAPFERRARELLGELGGLDKPPAEEGGERP